MPTGGRLDRQLSGDRQACHDLERKKQENEGFSPRSQLRRQNARHREEKGEALLKDQALRSVFRLFSFFRRFYLCLRERERTQAGGGAAGEADSWQSRDPDARLEPRTQDHD